MTNLTLKSVEVCFSPALFNFYNHKDAIVVVVDILRATTAICTAFKCGAEKIIPVASVEDLKKYKNQGFLVAGERDGKILDCADFGNSPFNFTTDNVNGKTLALSTTNGTQAIEMAKDADCIVIGSFLNLISLSEWIINRNKNVLILCAGWKNKFNLEDSIFAGALADLLLKSKKCYSDCDSTMAAIDLWNLSKNNLLDYIEKASHRHRLKKLGLDDVLEYCFTVNTTDVIPILKGDGLVNLNKTYAIKSSCRL